MKVSPPPTRWGIRWASEDPLQADLAIVLHPCEVNAHRHREIIEEIHHLTGITVSLAVEVVAAEAQINCGFHYHDHRLYDSL